MTTMKILINDNAASNYINRCYNKVSPEAFGLHNENFYQILKKSKAHGLK